MSPLITISVVPENAAASAPTQSMKLVIWPAERQICVPTRPCVRSSGSPPRCQSEKTKTRRRELHWPVSLMRSES